MACFGGVLAGFRAGRLLGRRMEFAGGLILCLIGANILRARLMGQRAGGLGLHGACADGTFYTGWTFDLAARVSAHNEGRGARYTSGRRLVELAFCEQVRSGPRPFEGTCHQEDVGRNKRRLAENFSARPGRSELPWPEREEKKESPGNT